MDVSDSVQLPYIPPLKILDFEIYRKSPTYQTDPPSTEYHIALPSVTRQLLQPPGIFLVFLLQ